MADATVNLEWLRTMSEEQLRYFRGVLVTDLAAAKARGRSGKYTVAFCTARITAIDQVLSERGVTVRAMDP